MKAPSPSSTEFLLPVADIDHDDPVDEDVNINRETFSTAGKSKAQKDDFV